MYRVQTEELAEPEIQALPPEALASYAELRTLLEVHPWSGDSYQRRNPDAPMRTHTFGPQNQGLAIYLIVEQQRRVLVLRVLWAG